MNWVPLVTDEDIAAFIDDVGGFHDGVLSEVHVSFGTHVEPDGSTVFDPQAAMTVHLLFQLPANAFNRPWGVELRFDQAAGAFFDACPPNGFPTILSASIERRDDLYYWCVIDDDIGSTTSPWVGGRRVSWRAQDTWVGDTPRYGATAPPVIPQG
jgi:hypothetical protein